MTRVCTICNHLDRWKVDRELVRRAPYRHIAARFSVSTGALQRHAKEHLPELLARAHEAEEREHATGLKAELEAVKGDVKRLMGLAESEGDYRAALNACGRALHALELQARVYEVIKDEPTVNILIAPTVQATILAALKPYPEARYAVADALSGVEEDRP